MKNKPVITVVVPSFNQGAFLRDCLDSIFQQEIALEVYVMDGGSTDNSLNIIKQYESKLAGWRSYKDDGQSAAINEGIALGTAPFVCWLNSDDFFYPQALHRLLNKLQEDENSPAAYGKCELTNSEGVKLSRYLTLPFNRYFLANYCFICQPGTLIRRTAWERVGGLNEELHMAMDYELWWKLANNFGKLSYFKEQAVAATRAHGETKTLNNIELHYKESIDVVRAYYGKVPLKWKWALPIMKVIRKIESLFWRFKKV